MSAENRINRVRCHSVVVNDYKYQPLHDIDTFFANPACRWKDVPSDNFADEGIRQVCGVVSNTVLAVTGSSVH